MNYRPCPINCFAALPLSLDDVVPGLHILEVGNDATVSLLFKSVARTVNHWAPGLRICPGKNFVHTNFVAVIAALTRSHRIETVRAKDESVEQARDRIMCVVNDSRVTLTL